VLTKYCVFSALDMSTLSAQGVIDAVERSRSRLGVDTIDLLQLYWQDYAIPK
jgi:aryl-alcohol dehydrogenase-like predicted oxidoreductase